MINRNDLIQNVNCILQNCNRGELSDQAKKNLILPFVEVANQLEIKSTDLAAADFVSMLDDIYPKNRVSSFNWGDLRNQDTLRENMKYFLNTFGQCNRREAPTLKENDFLARISGPAEYCLVLSTITLILGAVLGSVLDTSLHALTIIGANALLPFICGTYLAIFHNHEGKTHPMFNSMVGALSFLTFGQVVGLMVGGGIKGRLDLLIGGSVIFAMALFGFIATKIATRPEQKGVQPVRVDFG